MIESAKQYQDYKDSSAATDSAYTISSVVAHAISYATCYVLVDHVLHFGTFLENIGISKAGNLCCKGSV